MSKIAEAQKITRAKITTFTVVQLFMGLPRTRRNQGLSASRSACWDLVSCPFLNSGLNRCGGIDWNQNIDSCFPLLMWCLKHMSNENLSLLSQSVQYISALCFRGEQMIISEWTPSYRNVNFPAFAGIPTLMKSKFPHCYLFSACLEAQIHTLFQAFPLQASLHRCR